jgi:hypothetical protein
MSVLTLPKAFDDVQGANLLPKDWYVLKIVSDPTVEDNANAKAAAKGEKHDAQKVGQNYVIKMRVESDNPTYNGRPFTKYLSLPTEADKDRQMPNGQTVEDWKMEQIRICAEAFAGQPIAGGNEVAFEVGMRAAFYVGEELDRNETEMVNVLDMNTPPKPLVG